MFGEDVRTWQQRMRTRGWTITVDGAYGPQSEAVCRNFQRQFGLQVDGIVGPITWRTAFS
ncbi:MAG: peptidoglycan-binding protein [Actinobacteria bacterium]|nr:peptidoglycan-binding protein [Actinomycetota bacterium]